MDSQKHSSELAYANSLIDGLQKQQRGLERALKGDAIYADPAKKSLILGRLTELNNFMQTTLIPLLTPGRDSADGAFLSNDFYAAQMVSRSFAPPAIPKKQPLNDNNESKHGNVIKHPKHYTQGIETWDYIASQNLNYLEGNIVKYVTRHKHKNGREDLLKAQAYLNKLLEQVK